VKERVPQRERERERERQSRVKRIIFALTIFPYLLPVECLAHAQEGEQTTEVELGQK